MIRKPATRLLITIPALALLALGLLLALRPAQTPYLDLLRRGDEQAANTERAAAVAAYREAARMRPGDPAPYLRLAQVYLDWGRSSDALLALSEAERLGAAGTEETERLLVSIYAARAAWPTVTGHARQLLAIAPTDLDTRRTLAHAYVEVQEWDAAQAEYEEILRLNPDDQVAHEQLGALLLAGDDPAAIQHLYAAQTDLSTRLLMALLESSSANDPAYTAALQGRVLFAAQDWALAAHQFEQALIHNPDYPDAHAYLGHALDQMNRPDEALPHLQRAITLAPDSPVAHILMGLHYDRLGNLPAARAEYETAYDLDPANPATCVEIGQTWAAEGRYTAAEIWLQEAASLQPDDPALWEALARFYLDHNITAAGQAVDAAAELVRLTPNDAAAHDLRGWAALQAGDYATAQTWLQKAISLDPALAEAYYHLGLLWDVQGERQEAQEAYARALDLDTTGKIAWLLAR